MTLGVKVAPAAGASGAAGPLAGRERGERGPDRARGGR